MRVIGVFACLLVSTSLCGAGNSDPKVTAARAHYERGTAALRHGDYREAGQEYELAYEGLGDPVLLFDVGEAYRLAEDFDKAINAYSSYLRRLPDSPHRKQVERRIQDMKVRLKPRASAPPSVEPEAPAAAKPVPSPALET